MTTSIPNHSINYFAPLASGGTCSIGQVMIPNSSDSTYYVVATSANRGTRGSEGVALSAWGGSTGTAGQVKLAMNGVIPASVSGLSSGYGSRALVRCSTTGSMERVTSYTSGDDIIGFAESDGRVHLYFGFPWSLIAAAAGALPASPAYSVQYANSTVTATAGSTNVRIASDDALEVGYGTGTVATYGDIRGASGGVDGTGFAIGVRNGAGTGNLLPLTVFNATGFGDIVTFGGGEGWGWAAAGTPDYMYFYANSLVGFTYSTLTPQGTYTGMALDSWSQAGPIVGWNHRRALVLQRHTNLIMWGTRANIATADNALGGGEGVFPFGTSEVAPTTNPDQGVIQYCATVGSTNEMLYRTTAGVVRPMALVGDWWQADAHRINATANGYVSYGATGDTFPSSGWLRVSYVGSSAYQDLVTWHPESDDIPLLRTRLTGGVTELYVGGNVTDNAKIVDDLYLMGQSIEIQNADVLRFNLDHPTTNQNGLTELRFFSSIQTLDATVTTLYSESPSTNRTFLVQAVVSGVKSDHSQGAGYIMEALFLNNGGTVSQIGTTTVRVVGESDAAWDCTIDVNSNNVRVRVTGKAATTIIWAGHMWITKVT